MTPVEERIDHDLARKRAERIVQQIEHPNPEYGFPSSAEYHDARAYLGLLTEHSAFIEAAEAEDGYEWHNIRNEARLRVLEALPATESARKEAQDG